MVVYPGVYRVYYPGVYRVYIGRYYPPREAIPGYNGRYYPPWEANIRVACTASTLRIIDSEQSTLSPP